MATRRALITDDDRDILALLAIAAVWVPVGIVLAGWRWLRGAD